MTKCLKRLDPLQRTLLPNPDITNDQDSQKNQHLEQPEQSERLELHRPGEQKDRLHIEYHEQNGNDVEPHRVSTSRIVDRINTALIGHQLGL